MARNDRIMEKITCITVDDNPLDLDYIAQVIGLHPSLDLLHTCSHPVEALERIKDLHPKLLFLDIDMPTFNGLELLRSLNYEPLGVFVTAHSEYAWESYEAAAFDFILKPIRLDRFAKIVSRVEEFFEIKNKVDLADAIAENDYIIVKEGYEKHKIMLHDILYVEALKDYTKIVTQNKKVMTLSNLKQFLETLNSENFVRIHRSFAVAKDKITKIDGHYVSINNFSLPLGKTYKLLLKTLF